MEENLELKVKVSVQEAEQELDSLKKKAEDAAQAVEDIGDKSEESIAPVSDLGNAFEGVFQNAVQDASKLNGNLGDVFKAVKQGIPTVRSLNKTVLTGLTGIKAAIAGLGIGLIISGITLLTSKLVEYVRKTQDAKKAAERLNQELTKTTSAAADQIVRLTTLATKYQEVGESEEAQKKFIKDYRTEIEKTGIAINDVNTANEVFVNNTDEYIEALMQRAKAEGAYNLAVQKTQEYLEQLPDYQSKVDEARKNLEAASTVQGNWAANIIAKTTQDLASAEKKYNDFTASYNNALKDILKTGQEAAASASAILGDGTTPSSGSYSGSLQSAKELYEAWAKANPDKVIAGEYAVWVWENQIKEEGQKARQLAEIRERLGQPIANTDAEVEEETIQDVLKRNQTRKEAELDFQKELLDIELLPAREKNNQLYALEQERLESRKTYLQSLMSLELEDSTLRKEYADEILDIDNELALVNAKRIEQEKKDIAEEIQIYTTAVQSLADIFGTIAEMEEERIQRMVDQGQITEEEAKKQFETVKAWQYAQTWINTLAGMTAALTAPTMQSLGIPGWIAAAAQAASLLAQGIAQTAKIKNTQFGGGGTGGSIGGNTPNVGVTPIQIRDDIQQSPSVLPDSQAPTNQRVYILQSDLEDSHRQVEIRESASTF